MLMCWYQNANDSKAILTAFIAKVSKKGSKGQNEKQPAGSPKFVSASSECKGEK